MKKIIGTSLLSAAVLMAQLPTAEELSRAKAEKAEAEAAIAEAKAKLSAANAVLKEDKLITHTELSYISTDGNSDTESFALEARAKQKWDRHHLKGKLEAFYSRDGEVTTKNNWLAEGNYNYDMTERLAFDYLIGYKSDKFSSYDYQFYTGPGLKYHLIDAEVHQMNVFGNILYARDDIREDLSLTPPVVDEVNDYASWLAGFDYEWQMLENLKFTQEATFRSQVNDFENYFIYSKTAFSSKINSTLSMGVSYKIDYANEVAPDKERTDKTFLVSLIIDY